MALPRLPLRYRGHTRHFQDRMGQETRPARLGDDPDLQTKRANQRTRQATPNYVGLGKEFEMIETEVKTLYGFDHYIKGTEPFLSWWRAGLYLKFNQGPQTHVLVESYGNSINLDELRKGDTLRVRIDKVTTREISWVQKVKETVRSWVKSLEGK